MKLLFYTVVTSDQEVSALDNTIDSIRINNGFLDISYWLVFNGIKPALSASYHYHSFHIGTQLSLVNAIFQFRDYIEEFPYTHICRVDPGDTINSTFCSSFSQDTLCDISIPSYEMVDKSHQTLSVLKSSKVHSTA